MDEKTYQMLIEDNRLVAQSYVKIQVWKLAGKCGFDYNLTTGAITPLGDPTPIYRSLRNKRP